MSRFQELFETQMMKTKLIARMIFSLIFVLLFMTFPLIAANAEPLDGAINEITLENFSNALTKAFSSDGRAVEFFFLVGGLGAYSIFVWYFYRYISRRELFPRFYKHLESSNRKNYTKIGISAMFYVIFFPLVVLIWSVLYWIFILVMNLNADPEATFLISLALIGVIRLTAYFREDLARDVGKTLPFSMLAIFLTSIVISNGVNYVIIEKLQESIPTLQDNFIRILVGVFILSVLEGIFRGIFVLERRIRPVRDTKIEEIIEKKVDEITNIHFKKLEGKENELEKKINEDFEKLDNVLSKLKNNIDKNNKS